MIYVFMYLTAIILANVLAATFGPGITIINAFFLIGLDLTARDKLHDAWHGDRLLLKMGLLIAIGSVLSWVLNRDTGSIAIASFVAFTLAALTDTVIYQRLLSKPKWLRINGSNIPAALVDSLVFPTLAFGGFLWPIVIGQFLAKTAGGFLWSFILTGLDRKRVQRELVL